MFVAWLGPNAVFIVAAYAVTACILIGVAAYVVIGTVCVQRKLKTLTHILNQTQKK